MALFALWRDDTVCAPLATTLRGLRDACHVVPDIAADLRAGAWRIAAFATRTRFLGPEDQLWSDGAGGACVVHGVPWRVEAGRARVLDAAALAALLDRPGRTLPDDVAGEYSVARLHRCGTLEAFADPAGVHQLFYRGDMLASRARFLALLAGDLTPDPDAGLWLTAIGYRVGTGTAWRGVTQLAQAHRVTLAAGAARLAPLADPAVVGDAPRGFDEGLFAEGVGQAVASIRLAAGSEPLDLPITGGKDSRAVLALALAAGLAQPLTLFTRGYPGHPDVVAGQRIAAALGLPHRREPPLGSDAPPDLTVDAFVAALAAHAAATDGNMGGWDLLVPAAPGAGTLLTGHMGEVLKAFSKQAPPADPDPVAMVRLQSPFDPLDLLRPAARAGFVARLADDMAAARAHGAAGDDLPDLFYYRNRIPNWLGGIRGVRSFERQPIMPLGVPALQRLAFRLTAAERRAEPIHHRLVRDCAPALLDLPFAHQHWDPSLGRPDVPPVLAAAGAPLFGTWQWSINHVPAIRAWLSDFVAATDIALWDGIDRAALLDRLRHRRFDYRDGISLLGVVAAAFHAAAPRRPAAAHARVEGHVDAVATAGDRATIGGWAWAPDWPGAAPVLLARAGGETVGRAVADGDRPDLAAAGIGSGRYGFSLDLPADRLATVTLAGFDAPDAPIPVPR